MRWFLAPALLLSTVPAIAAENRCGILANPSPANWWLTDRDGEWIIGAQGGYQADGVENIPGSFFGKGWVAGPNGNYGHRCGCLRVESDRATMRIHRIHSATPLPMRRCDADKALQRRLGR